MIKSMTAFARVSESVQQFNWVIEIRSLNNRYFDLSLRLPTSLMPFENEIRELVQSYMKRGKVTLNAFQDNPEDNAKKLQINEPLVGLYLNTLSKIQKKYKIRGEVTMSDILRIPGLFEFKKTEDNPQKTWIQVKKIIKKSLEAAIESKKVEGKKLLLDIQKRLEGVTEALLRVKKQTEQRSEVVARKLQDRISGIIKDSTLAEDERFLKEVAYLVEKADITEEMVRLNSHIDLFFKRLKSDGEVGRELDFLCQEMNREVNTIGSKSQLFEISTEVVFMKGELEKIREQIQNIE